MPNPPRKIPSSRPEYGLGAAAAALRATVARIRAERLFEKAVRTAERSRKRREVAERLLAASLLSDPLAN